MDTPTAPPEFDIAAHNPKRWLASSDAGERLSAVTAHTVPGAITPDNLDAFIGCIKLSHDEPDTLLIAAFTLGAQPPEQATPALQDCLAGFLTRIDHEDLRVAAAHALHRLETIPTTAHEPLCAMLLDPVKMVREMALLTLSIAPTSVAAPLARMITGTKRASWTPEAMTGLVQSAGDAPLARQQICSFLRTEVAKDANVPAVIAGFVELIQSDGNADAVQGLADIAVNPRTVAHRPAALQALAQLGVKAQSAGPALVELLNQTDDPSTETLLCKTLGKIQIEDAVVPVQRATDRIARGPEIVLAPYCGLLSLYPVASKDAAVSVRKRFETSSEGVRSVLAFTYRGLTGEMLK